MTPDEAFDSLNIRRLTLAAPLKYFAVEVTEDNLDLLALAFDGIITHQLVDDPEHPEAKIQVRDGIAFPAPDGNPLGDPMKAGLGQWLVHVETPIGSTTAPFLPEEFEAVFDDDGPLRDRDQLELDLAI